MSPTFLVWCVLLLSSSTSTVLIVRSQTVTQLHIALTSDPTEMSVMWTTSSVSSSPVVQYGLSAGSLTTSASANSNVYTVGSYTSGHIHTAILTGLKPEATYFYRAGDASGSWSTVSSFQTSRSYPIRFIATGDIGTAPVCLGCPQTVAQMVQAHNQMNLDFLIHSGDMSYANGNQSMWDDWQNQMAPIAKTVPYMVSVGNHEIYDNFIAFQNRFLMPTASSDPTGGNFWYSFDYGPVHFIILDSESTSFKHHLDQYQWLESDLASVSRSKTPWLFTSWHRPWYTSKKKVDDQAEAMREKYEDLLHKYSVQILFNGHNHAYERTQPMYNGEIDSTGFVTLITGNGGTKEMTEKDWIQPEPTFSVTRTLSYGIGIVTIYNNTHLNFQMQLQTGEVFDNWWLTQ